MTATMTAKAAAEYLGLSYWAILELAKAGKIRHIRTAGRVLFRQGSLDKWLTEQEALSVQQDTEPVAGEIRRLQ